MTHKLKLALFSLLVAAPALACGGPAISDLQFRVLTSSMIAAPILAALLVDRGAFTLAAYALKMPRRHRPSAVGPLLAVLAALLAVSGAAARDIDLAITGFALVPAAAVVCALSMVRSVAIDLRGQNGARLLRVAAIVAFVAVSQSHFLG